ncbi:hypothetical protein B0H14DRAFT_3454872 [Mycena olivaceomarginata]|nr:hypothetical protein B0H14DRAFT_3454872 [Mycena olivaceomarginata]
MLWTLHLGRPPPSALACNSSCLRLARLLRAPCALSTPLVLLSLTISLSLRLSHPISPTDASATLISARTPLQFISQCLRQRLNEAPLPSRASPPSPPAASAHSAFILVLVPSRATGILPLRPLSPAIKPIMRDPRLYSFSFSRARSRRPYALAVAPSTPVERDQSESSEIPQRIYIHSFSDIHF